MNEKMQHRIRALCLTLLFSLTLALALPAAPVRAENGVERIKEFEDLKNDDTYKYLSAGFRGNYTLDLGETGVMDAVWVGINSIANVIFFAVRMLGYVVAALFFWSLKFDIGNFFGSQINGMQQVLHDSIYEPLLLAVFGACFCTLLKKFWKRDMAGSAAIIGKIILSVALSMFVVMKSDTALSLVTNTTKEISIDALCGVNDSLGMGGSIENFAAKGAGILWLDLVHEPWKTAEFINYSDNVTDKMADSFLSEHDEEKKAELVESYGDVFDKKIGVQRVGFLIIYLLPFLAKCLVFIVVSGLLIIFQILAVFYLILAPIMLLLFLFSGYEVILGAWLRKMLETQIMLLIIMCMLALLIRMDALLFAQAQEWGWFIVLMIQIIVGAALYLGRGQIFTMLSTVQRGTATPRYAANRMRMAGNISNMQNIRKNAGRLHQNSMAMLSKMGIAAARTPAGAAAAATAAGAAGAGAVRQVQRPVYKPPQKAAQPEVAAQAGTAAKQTKQQTAQRREPLRTYVQSGALGCSIGAAAAGIASTPGRVRDAAGMAGEKVRSAPVRFKYEAQEQLGDMKADIKSAPGKVLDKVESVADKNLSGISEGFRQGTARNKEQAARRETKKTAYRTETELKRVDMHISDEKRKETKRKPIKFKTKEE